MPRSEFVTESSAPFERQKRRENVRRARGRTNGAKRPPRRADNSYQIRANRVVAVTLRIRFGFSTGCPFATGRNSFVFSVREFFGVFVCVRRARPSSDMAGAAAAAAVDVSKRSFPRKIRWDCFGTKTFYRPLKTRIRFGGPPRFNATVYSDFRETLRDDRKFVISPRKVKRWGDVFGGWSSK